MEMSMKIAMIVSGVLLLIPLLLITYWTTIMLQMFPKPCSNGLIGCGPYYNPANPELRIILPDAIGFVIFYVCILAIALLVLGLMLYAFYKFEKFEKRKGLETIIDFLLVFGVSGIIVSVAADLILFGLS